MTSEIQTDTEKACHCFFFFQAEDGIRDSSVTGVQTCALPIYRGSTVAKLCASPHAKVLACDTDWRRRYRDRSQHPETDGEKLTASGDRVTRISRRIEPAEASGEFIGVAKLTAEGPRQLGPAFDA